MSMTKPDKWCMVLVWFLCCLFLSEKRRERERKRIERDQRGGERKREERGGEMREYMDPTISRYHLIVSCLI